MTVRKFLFVAAAIAAAIFVTQNSAQALTMSECSAKYKGAKAAGTLNGATWNDFRKSQCDLAPAQRAKSAAPDSTVVAANAIFPSAVDSKYSNEKPGRARRKTCLGSVQGQQSGQCQWRAEMAAAGRRLLQPVHQEAQGRGVAEFQLAAASIGNSSPPGVAVRRTASLRSPMPVVHAAVRHNGLPGQARQ
jgi:hypothetical protein